MNEYTTYWKCVKCGTMQTLPQQVYGEYETKTMKCKGCKRQRKHIWVKTQGVKPRGSWST